MITLIDQDIAHIARVMRPSLVGDLGGPILPVAYWRKRLQHLLDVDHLTKAQFCVVDRLLLELDDFDVTPASAPRQTTGEEISRTFSVAEVLR